MKLFNTSKKNKKEDLKIVFEPFVLPGNEKTNKKTIKNTLLTIVIIILLILLFIFSSLLNEKILYGNIKNDYGTNNTFNGNFLVIKEENRKDLLEKIGFDYSKNTSGVKDGEEYEMTYAFRKKTEFDNLVDSINIYYDKTNMVNFIDLKLVYKEDEFSLSNSTLDSNNIINSFTKINISKNAISKANKNGNYNYVDKNTNAKIYCSLEKQLNKYYILNIKIEK